MALPYLVVALYNCNTPIAFFSFTSKSSSLPRLRSTSLKLVAPSLQLGSTPSLSPASPRVLHPAAHLASPPPSSSTPHQLSTLTSTMIATTFRLSGPASPPNASSGKML
ncbi:hypothetical protein CDL15_Pgr027951 [Punica granatum]|uniref:Uncharacterized protein n=1 Tax=Punica granatum TaxID=22663 RepID=A0A218XJW1_PUNGR|nr:hypothetical protein CDL15_Pgr027951 [Punica granatum]